ncbi:MAG: glutathione-disulfide reductase [Wenzhouxiangellaceae bacterium]
MSTVDLMVIGAGSGGVRAARIAAAHGAKVAICEESRVGGTCVIRGCVPKKLLSYAAHFHEDFEDAAAYGWDLTGATHDWSRLIANKDQEIDRLNRIYLKLLENSGVQLLSGRGRLMGANTVAVGDQIITAGKILIATGGRPYLPDIPGRELAITSDEAFHLPQLPRRVVVVGGGYIAVEFACIFNGLGAEVTLVYRRDRILRGFDADIRQQAEVELARKGIRILHDADITEISGQENDLTLHLNQGESLSCEQVMFATGRAPYTWDLGLEQAGVNTDHAGAIIVDDHSASNVSSVYAVGDVTNRINLTPVAIREGHAFADSVFGQNPRTADHHHVPSAVFMFPPIASVGYTQDRALDHYRRLRIYRSTFRALKHTLSGRQEQTLMKLIVDDATDQVVGLHVIGMDAPEMVQGFAVAVKAGLTKTDFDQTVGIHPTSAEEMVTLREVSEVVEG